MRGLAARVLLASFDGPTLPDWARRRLEHGLGGICLYGTNIVDRPQIAALNRAVHEVNPLAITSLDEEGGDVTRLYYLEGSPHAGHAVLGRADDVELTLAVAADVGTELLAHGVDLDLGPVADVNSTPDNPVIGVRSFGSDPTLVARHVSAWVRGVQSAGSGACLKHFPGHGDTTVDSHLALPTVTEPLEVLRERELVPFVAGVRAGAVAVMTSHVVVPAVEPDVPATFSAAATRLLREEVGFTGLLVSDALDMQGASGGRGIPAAAVLALAAGVDLLCLGSSFTDQRVQDVVDAIVDAVGNGDLPWERLTDAASRVDVAAARLAELRAHAKAAPNPEASTQAARRAVDTGGQPLATVVNAQVLRVLTGTNEAVGHAPWGLPEQGSVLSGGKARDVRQGDQPWLDLGPEPVVVLVRDAHRHPWAQHLIAQVVAARPDTVVVEMGWPADSDPIPPGTLRTWGASAASSSALDAVLSGAAS
ncbi:glycoside hydrolase family 3 N-terminal domain-containing protein [Angustibacter sp. McL0619]|uniref:glycoside hydrolase family 3 N-terminal domain-containing protein n=1 Tax=Angustibacter sp. McL0619 TaxID=3415676 RepID=UPI003CEE62C2